MNERSFLSGWTPAQEAGAGQSFLAHRPLHCGPGGLRICCEGAGTHEPRPYLPGRLYTEFTSRPEQAATMKRGHQALSQPLPGLTLQLTQYRNPPDFLCICFLSLSLSGLFIRLPDPHTPGRVPHE